MRPCTRCHSIYEPIGACHTDAGLCPQCSPVQRCARCFMPGTTNKLGLCRLCAAPAKEAAHG